MHQIRAQFVQVWVKKMTKFQKVIQPWGKRISMMYVKSDQLEAFR